MLISVLSKTDTLFFINGPFINFRTVFFAIFFHSEIVQFLLLTDLFHSVWTKSNFDVNFSFYLKHTKFSIIFFIQKSQIAFNIIKRHKRQNSMKCCVSCFSSSDTNSQFKSLFRWRKSFRINLGIWE